MNKLILSIACLALALSTIAVIGSPDRTKSPVRDEQQKDDQRFDALEKRLDELSDDVMTLMRAARQAAPKPRANAEDPSTRAGRNEANAPQQENNSGTVGDNELDSRIAALEQKLRRRNPFGQWMAKSEELETALGLTKEQSAQAKQLFNEVKDQTLELLSITNEDGRAPLDDLVDDFRKGMNFKQALGELVKRMEASIPGSSDTYSDRMQGIEGGLFERLEGALNNDQMERLRKANIAPTMVQTGYDPVGEYIRQSLEADGKR